MKCFTCGAVVAPTAQYCGQCGTRVGDPHEATVVVPLDDHNELLQRVRMVVAGDYDVEEEVARGGMGVVFKAREAGLQRTVALKVLPPDLGLTARAVERFKREARMVAELDHPNVMPVYRVGQIGGVLYIAMKFVDGRSLGAIVEAQGALPIPVVLHVLRGAARALAYAHDRGIVHRDVKGGNILVDRDGRILVTDFGVALRSSDTHLTTDGAVIGTPPFMSPEQCKGDRAGPQSDQYSLGIIAFQMLTGAVPFQAETLAGMMQHHFFTPVPDLHLIRDGVPDAVVDVINVALAKQPFARYASTRDMLAAIEAIPFSEGDRRDSERMLRTLAAGGAVDRIATRAAPPLPDAFTQPIPVPQRRSKRRPLVWTGVAGAAILAALVGWWGRGGLTPRAEPPAVRGDTAQRPAPATLRPVAGQATLAPGRLRMLTTPPDAEILIDDRRVGIGSVFDLDIPSGTRQLRVRAPGYRTFDTTIIVVPGHTVTLGRIALRSVGGGA